MSTDLLSAAASGDDVALTAVLDAGLSDDLASMPGLAPQVLGALYAQAMSVPVDASLCWALINSHGGKLTPDQLTALLVHCALVDYEALGLLLRGLYGNAAIVRQLATEIEDSEQLYYIADEWAGDSAVLEAVVINRYCDVRVLQRLFQRAIALPPRQCRVLLQAMVDSPACDDDLSADVAREMRARG